ncbi:unnamed protein product [Porites lobata]|uniref:G-protein coupled receptors family 1 profile domain-containing protein n=1 Tax=Porites lobata TaxID=104759 RepID=A0ABN8PLT6_9CNID|nr:unnamed protein product [Porites lobata]
MLNIATIHAITKTSSLPKPLKTLLLSLAASDLGVGLLVQPLFITLLIQWLQQLSPSCIMYTSFSVAMNLFFTASFANIIGITLDRYLAIQLHLRYHNIVTHWRVIAVVIFIWLFSIFLSLRMFWLPSTIKYLVLAVVGILSVLATTLLYIKIYLVLRRHTNQIQALQVQQTAQNGERTANFANLRRSAIGIRYNKRRKKQKYTSLYTDGQACSIKANSFSTVKDLMAIKLITLPRKKLHYEIAHFYAHDQTKTLSLQTFLAMKYDIITGSLFCEEIRPYYPSIDEAEDLHVSQIVNCVFNAFLSYNTVMLNIATIHAITRTSSLPKPLKTLLLSLAASDLGVGLLVQPLFITLLIQWLQQLSPSCIMYTSFSVAMNLFFTASFANIIGITLDRCLAIQLHLRYDTIVTHWRVIAVVIFIWLFSIFLSLRMFWLPSAIRYLILAVVGILSVLATTLLYIKIYLVLRRHRNQIQALQVQQTAQNGERTANFANLRRSAVGTGKDFQITAKSPLLTFVTVSVLTHKKLVI